MTSYYEFATTGLNDDQFLDSSSTFTDDLSGELSLTKMKQHFWTAKQLFCSKFKKKEDACLMASDAEFDAKLSRFSAAQDTTRQLLSTLEDYHHFTKEIIECKKDLILCLHDKLLEEKEHLQKVMNITVNCFETVLKQHKKLLTPLTRFYNDLDVFNERAVFDCQNTVDLAEKTRIEYRGSLLWIKSISKELDPSSSDQMENFRKTQAVVRQNQEKFNILKTNTFQKVDLLTESRSILLLDLSKHMCTAIAQFYEDSAKVYQKSLDNLLNIETYEIDVLKILNDPVGLVLERQKQLENNTKEKNQSDLLINEKNMHHQNKDNN